MKKIKKIKIIGKAKIYETDDGKYVVKKEKKDLSNLFDYLSFRGITTFANRINKIDDLIRYEYVETSNFINDSDYIDFIKNVAILHYKTAYFKTESRKVFKDIYNKLIDKVDYLKDYCDLVFLERTPGVSTTMIKHDLGLKEAVKNEDQLPE